ncbi:hypothetical protein F5Y17DRAFT_455739 [Xylariaceae sp. FL0594]|nr:hypothetical protein F5Y17DRAFT_455739 [Xylariaceae sp. FL0594]
MENNTRSGDGVQPATSTRSRRGSGPSYEGLMNYKRSNDPNSVARRASLHDQKPPAGFFGTMWNTKNPGVTATASALYQHRRQLPVRPADMVDRPAPKA